MGNASQDPSGAMSACGPRSPQQGATRADEIIDDNAGGASDVAYEQVARNNPGAAVLFCKSLADLPAQRCFQCFSQQVRALSSSQIWRDDAKRFVADDCLDRINQQRRSCQRHGAAAKRIFEGGLVVDLEVMTPSQPIASISAAT